MGEVAGVIFFSFFTLLSPLFAQPQNSPLKAQSFELSEEELMNGPPSGMSMDKMMRGPKISALYPTMINSSDPTPAERERMEQEAKLWVAEGIAILTEGAAALTEATQQTDVTTMRLASTQIGEGLCGCYKGLAITAL